MDRNLSKLQQIVEDTEALCFQVLSNASNRILIKVCTYVQIWPDNCFLNNMTMRSEDIANSHPP